MAAPKYIAKLPAEEVSLSTFFFVNSNFIERKVLHLIKPLEVGHLRQLLVLQALTNQRRRTNLGLCAWYKYSPIGGKTIKARRELFNKFAAELFTSGYVIIYDVPQGRAAELTLKGELLVEQVNTYITDYYRSIFAQFNLVPTL